MFIESVNEQISRSYGSAMFFVFKCYKHVAPPEQNAWSTCLAVAEGFEPSHGRINSAVPYQLGYATKLWWLWVDSNHQPRAYETLALSV